MEREQKERSIFDEFTRKYQLSKTLRFELRPLPATREFLKIDGDAKERIFPKDRERAQNYERLKYYLDLLHRDFINKSLVRFKKEGESIDFETLYEHRGNEGYEEDEREEGNSTEIENVPSKKDALGKARSDIVKSFKENGFLFGKEVINRLEEKFIQEGENILMVNGESKERIPDLDAPCILFTNAEGDEETIFQNFRGFTGYLSGYHENRKNLYKDDRKAGRVVTRIIDQNLPRFFENKDKLNIMLEKYPSLDAIFSNIEAWKDYFKEKELDIKTAIHSFITDGCNWKRVFESDYYNSCFLQQDIQFYNYVIRKLNKDINEYRHKLASEKNKSEGNTSDKKKKLPFLKELHKQILGEIKKKSDFIEVTQPTLGAALRNFIEHSEQKRLLSEQIVLENFLKKEDVNGIYISSRAINTISSRWFTNWDFFGGKILEKENEGLSESKKKKKISPFVSVVTLREVLNGMDETDQKEIFKQEFLEKIRLNGTSQNFLSIWKEEFAEMLREHEKSKKAVEAEMKNIPAQPDERTLKEQKLIIKRFADASLALYQMTKYFALLKGVKEVQKDDKDGDFYALMDVYLFGGALEDKEYDENHIYEYYNALRNFLTKKEWNEDKLKLNFENGSLLNGWSQSKEDEYQGVLFEKNGLYYFGIIKSRGIFDYRFTEDDMYSGSGDKRRKKRQENIERIWREKKDLRRTIVNDNPNCYSKIEYYAIADVVKDVPGLLLSRANFQNLEKFKKMFEDAGGDFSEVQRIKQEETFKGKDKNINDLYTIIDYYKTAIPKTSEKETYSTLEAYVSEIETDGYSNWRCFEFKFSETKGYKDFSKFLNEVNKQGYKIKKIGIDEGYIESKIRSGELYLFQICNKDFQLDEKLNGGNTRKIEGREDMETALFRTLFDDKNLKNKNGIVLTLNGGAEVFFRDSSLDKKLENRNFKREIERKKRYTENKMFLHVPITLNFGKPGGRYSDVNDLFNKTVLQNPELSEKVKIIGIDRGEKNLAYYSVIDQEGAILEQGTSNRIYEKNKNGSPIERDKKMVDFDKDAKKYVLKKTGQKVNYTDYLVPLECKEKNRLLERRSWDAIESIKDLKKGYISHVVHQLCELLLKYLEQDGIPPIIVFEKLNVGFKQGRQKIERQVYQNLELALAKKLNYLAEKGRKEHEAGGILNALQFTPEIKNFGSDVEKKSQVGIIFYADPSYTSTTCPNCGFRKRINKTAFESAEKAKKKFEEHNVRIHFERGEYKFIFTVYRGKENGKDGESIQDIVYSGVERIYRRQKENGKGWIANKFESMTQKIDELLNGCGRSIDKNSEIFSQIKRIDDKDFWRQMMWYFNLILQVRNSASRKYTFNEKTREVEEDGFDVDFIHCPHCHFHSENQKTWGLFGDRFSENIRKEISGREESIFNGDANGAYNIARKGILMIKRVRQHPERIQTFLARNNMTELELKKKIVGGRYEIMRGKGRDKEIVDSISKYPDLFITNEEWDDFTQRQWNPTSKSRK